MKNNDLMRLMDGFDSVNNLEGVKFAYAVSKNRRLVINEIETLQDCIKPAEKYTEYDKKRMELCEKYSEKNDNDEPITENGQYKITDRVEFDKSIDELKKSYNGEIESRVKQLDEYKELLNKETVLELHKISLGDLPKDITSGQLNSIYEIIKED